MRRRLAAIIIKEFVQLVRDPRTLALALLMPVIQLLLFGYAITTDGAAPPPPAPRPWGRSFLVFCFLLSASPSPPGGDPRPPFSWAQARRRVGRGSPSVV